MPSSKSFHAQHSRRRNPEADDPYGSYKRCLQISDSSIGSIRLNLFLRDRAFSAVNLVSEAAPISPLPAHRRTCENEDEHEDTQICNNQINQQHRLSKCQDIPDSPASPISPTATISSFQPFVHKARDWHCREIVTFSFDTTTMTEVILDPPPYPTRITITSVMLLVNHPPNRTSRYLRSHFFRVFRCGSLPIFIFYNNLTGVPSLLFHLQVCLDTGTEFATLTSHHLVCPMLLSCHSIP